MKNNDKVVVPYSISILHNASIFYSASISNKLHDIYNICVYIIYTELYNNQAL